MVFTVFYLNTSLRCIRHALSRLQSAGQQYSFKIQRLRRRRALQTVVCL